jgi:carbamoyl-phosphate synthase large subunit
MPPLTVLVTAAGAPGTAALLRALRANGERDVRLVGCDMNELAVGRFLCDTFERVPPGAEPKFGAAIATLCEREGVDVVLPQSSHDLAGLAAARDEVPANVLVSAPETVRVANDKAACYTRLAELGVRVPEFRRVRGREAFAAAAAELGYPGHPLCFKPAYSSGSRGFRILDPEVDRAHQLFHERRAGDVLPDADRPGLDGDRRHDRRRTRRRALLQHPARRRRRH